MFGRESLVQGSPEMDLSFHLTEPSFRGRTECCWHVPQGYWKEYGIVEFNSLIWSCDYRALILFVLWLAFGYHWIHLPPYFSRYIRYTLYYLHSLMVYFYHVSIFILFAHDLRADLPFRNFLSIRSWKMYFDNYNFGLFISL